MIALADKVDELFERYFSGELEVKYNERRVELMQFTRETDDNVGGGKLENVNNEQKKVESRLIKELLDPQLNKLADQYVAMFNFTRSGAVDVEVITMLEYYYDKRKHNLWKKVARMAFKSERQCQYDRDKAKYRFLLQNADIV